jgi:PPK2 family polyphosphate:nucleotide phosphotransferase
MSAPTRTERRALADLIAPMRVEPGSRVRLSRDHDPGWRPDIDRDRSAQLLCRGVEHLEHYQARLAAQDTWALLVVLQAMDAAGKDSTIRHVMSGVNPQGVTVHSFKQPSHEELDHDYLWRYARRLPARGQIGIFNRSHYEEVLVVRVHRELLEREQLPAAARRGGVWKRRYRQINDWERYLSENGVRIVKLFLNLSRDEQRQRFLKRIDQPSKNWKFSPADVAERRHWDDYQRAYSDMLSHTSTEWAPWYVLPADHKWVTRLAASAAIVQALIDLDPRYPVLEGEQLQVLEDARVKLEAEAPKPPSL